MKFSKYLLPHIYSGRGLFFQSDSSGRRKSCRVGGKVRRSANLTTTAGRPTKPFSFFLRNRKSEEDDADQSETWGRTPAYGVSGVM
jgi:hypothetical protein